MEKYIRFPLLSEVQRLHTIIRSVPDDWSGISGYLISPEVPLASGAASLNVLMIADSGISIHRADSPPGLCRLFVSRDRIDKVVFEVHHPQAACTEYRDLAAGLVEQGYLGIIGFTKKVRSSVWIAGLHVKVPARLNLGSSAPDLSPDFDSILSACSKL